MLRPAGPPDFAFIRALQARPELVPLIAADEEEALHANLDAPDIAMFIWQEDGAPAGFVFLAGLTSKSRNREIRRIAVADPGQGTGTRCLRAIQGYAFETLDTNRLWLDVAADNAQARHVYTRMGFREEGYFRRAWLRRTGDFADLVIMAMLREEWAARPPT
ncbi:MAG: GNAT family protein [Pseudomonadota bacterium]